MGEAVNKMLADRGHRGDYAPPEYKGKVFVTGQRRDMPASVTMRLRRRNAVEAIIVHVKKEHRMGINCLAHEPGDAINEVLAAVGYKSHLLLSWERLHSFPFPWRVYVSRFTKWHSLP